LQAENERKKNVELLNRIGKDITATLALESIIATVYENVNALMEASVFGIGIYNKEKACIDFPATREKGEPLPFYSYPLADDDRLAVWCFKHQQEVVINDYANEYQRYMKLLKPAVAGEDPESVLYLPLTHKEEKIGVITTQSFQKHAYADYHLNLLQNLATYTAIAPDNARLFAEAQQARAAAMAADEAKSSSLSTVSHELRTPLTSVVGFAKITKKRLEERVFPNTNTDDPKTEKTVAQVAENLNVVVAEGERLTNLINDVLDLAKIEADKIEWKKESLAVPEILERAAAATAALFESKKAPIHQRLQRRAAANYRRPRPADSSGDQPDLERGQIHRRGFGHLPRAGFKRRARGKRDRHRRRHRPRESAESVREIQASGRHFVQPAERHGFGPADLQRNRRASPRPHLGGK